MAQEPAPNDRAILVVLGSDRPGIVAGVTAELANHGVNILDISQTILQGIFTMTMLVDLRSMDVDFEELHAALQKLAREVGVQVTLQREDLFKLMYRL